MIAESPRIRLAAVLSLLLGAGCRPARPPARPQQEAALPRVVVEPVRRADLVRQVDVTGQIAPLAEVRVIPKVSGRLERLRLPCGERMEVGAMVRQGDIVAVIEHAALEAAVQQARAALDLATATAADAEREKQRWESLYAAKSATEQQRDRAVTASQIARAQKAQAEAALRQAEIALGEATIRAPLSGTVSRRFVDEGDMVGPTTPLLQIADLSVVRVLAPVGERFLTFLQPGQTPAVARVDAFPDQVVSGVVYRVGVTVDPGTRTVELEARFPNPDGRLKPGLFARLTLTLESRRGVLTVPEHAILTEEGRPFVRIVRDNRIERRSVTLGLSQGSLQEILDGLAAGDLVVVRGQRSVPDGEAVAIERVETAP